MENLYIVFTLLITYNLYRLSGSEEDKVTEGYALETDYGLKNPICMGICPSNSGKFDQNAASQQGAVVSASAPRRGAI